MIIYANNVCRSMRSGSAVWATARAGFAVIITPERKYPDFYLSAGVWSNSTHFLWRGFLSFPIPPLPTGYIIDSAKIGVFVWQKPNVSGTFVVADSYHSEPVIVSDWPKQPIIDWSFGMFDLATIVVGQLNEIDLNDKGIEWLQRVCKPKDQNESLDSGANFYMDVYSPRRIYQSFTPLKADYVSSVRWTMKRQAGTPPAYYCALYECDAAHKPTGSPIRTSDPVTGITDVTTWGIWYTFTFDPPIYRDKNKEYAYVLWSPTATTSNYARAIGATGEKYSLGVSGYSLDNGATWTLNPAGYDQYFIEYNHLFADMRQLRIDSLPDFQNIAPPPGYRSVLHYYHPQKGVTYAPRLSITYHTPPP